MVAEQVIVGIAYIIAGIASLTFLLPALSNLDRPGSTGFLVVIVGITVWSVCNGLNKFVISLSTSVTLTKFVFLGAQTIAIGWFLLSIEYTGRVRFTRWLGAVIAAYLLGWQSLVWTDHVHHLFLRPTTRMSEGLLVPEYNVGFWVFVATTYVPVVAGTALLVQEGRRSSGIRREQSLILASSLLPPVVANVVTLTPVLTFPYDLTPMGFIGSAVLFIWALYGSRFLDILPVARATVVREINDPIVTLDDTNALVDYNPAAAELFDIDEEDLGTPVTDAVETLSETAEGVLHVGGTQTEITISDDGRDRHFDSDVSALRSDSGPGNGQVVVLREITPLKRRQQQLREREQELKEQTERLEELTTRIETQYRQLFEKAPVMTVVTRRGDGEPVIEDCNQLFADTLGYERESVLGRNLAEFYTRESERQLLDESGYDRAISGEIKREERTLLTADGESIETLLRAVPRESADDEPEGTLAMYVDISTRREIQREKARFEELYQSAREILGEDSREEMSEVTVRTVQSALGLSSTGVYLYDRETEALEPVATSEQVSEVFEAEVSGYTDRETVVWEVYESGDPVRIDDTRTFGGTLPNEDTPTRSAVVVPIGAHGVLITSSLEPDAFDDDDVYFLRLVCQFVEFAFDRVANNQRLVATQKTIQKALYAETHEQMVDIVLEEISDELDLPIAGIWKYQPARRTLEPLAMTDTSRELFEEQPAFSEGESLAWQTFESGSTSIVSDVSEHPEAYSSETPVKGEIIVPIGEFGVLIAGSTVQSSFTRIDANVLEILAGNLEAVSQLIQQRQEVDLFDQVIDRILRHNVRNRLTPISGYAQQIIEEGAEPAETYAERIVDASEELRKTSRHAREMRQVVENVNREVTAHLRDEVLSAVETVDAEFPDGEVVVDIRDEPEVTAHPELETAIRHLIRNGLEHNTSNTPRVTVTLLQTTAGSTVEVADNGPGIDTHELDVLDEHGESALRHGTGAGLWIVDRVVDYSDAVLDFSTADGTKITITFPSS